MFKFKRTLASLLAVVMVLGISLTAVASTNQASESKHKEAIETLKALGIMVGDKDTLEFREGEPIRRSEFAKVAVHALGLEDVAAANSLATNFPDVVENHWASGYINVATNQSIIIGDTAGNFRPDDNITYAEAMTILVRMLGYDPAANSRGGFPTGYIVVGTENGIGSKVSGTSSVAVDRATVAQMTFNSLTVNLMEQTGFGSDVNYNVVDKTLLGDKLNVEKIEGKLTANENTYVSGGTSVGEGRVMIEGKVYRDGELDVEGFLGMNVTGYAREDYYTGDMTLVTVMQSSTKNKVLTIDADDIESVSASEIKYWVTETKSETVRLANAELIYNGKADNMENLEIPASGSMTLIDNNSDNRYEVISVREHKNIVVEDTSSISYTVIDKYGANSMVLDPENRNIRFSIKDADGSDVSFADLKEWDVLSAVTSRDGALVRVTVIRDSVQGKVGEVTADKLFINGNEYEVAANYHDSIELNDEAMFYLDIDGKIAAVDTNVRASSNYAYLIAAGKTAGIDAYLEIQLFGADGKVAVLRGADRMSVDGVSGRNYDQALAALRNGGSSVEPTLITYDVNSAGEVHIINRAVDRSAQMLGSYKGVFTLNAKLEDAVYKSASMKLDGINVNEETVIFDIPAGVTDPEEYAVRDYKMLENDGQYNAYVYDMSEDMTAKVLIVSNADGSTSLESPILVVDKVTKTFNQNNSEILKLYGYQNGEMVEVFAAENQKLEKAAGVVLSQGDVIQYKKNFSDEIDGITVLFDTRNMDEEGRTVYSDDAMTIYGKVARRFNGSINVTTNNGVAENFKTNGVMVYKYDSGRTNNQITLASAADIQKYDEASPERVFMRLYKDEVKEIVIIR